MKRGIAMRSLDWLVTAALTVGLISARSLFADEKTAISPQSVLGEQAEDEMLARTLGGRQFWGDVNNFHGWRIQQNTFTKHYRLIDARDVRHAWGTFEECLTALDKAREDHKLDKMKGPAVILIHGLLQSSRCMTEMGVTIEKSGYTAVKFDYPSTQVSIPDAARFLDRMVKSLDGIDEINFVVHSMGGLVVRAYAMEYSDPRIKRMVMLGTPNRGAELADITQQSWFLRTAAGPGARQLGTRSDGLIPKLPVPKFEFAVIAGSRGTATGWNPLIPGDDDGTVTVASTKLQGATDFNTVRATHSRLLWSEEAIAQTVSFLKDGRLRAGGETQPIQIEDVAKATKTEAACAPDDAD